MRVLYVCTANVCRSVTAANVLQESLSAAGIQADIEVRSAGTEALPGLPACPVMSQLTKPTSPHQSRALTEDLVAWADLIITAERRHRAAVAELGLASRQRSFTMQQAARISDWLVDSQMVTAGFDRTADRSASWADRFVPGDPRRDVGPMPHATPLRGRWLVTEMDAARGMVPVGTDEAAVVLPRRRVRRLRDKRPARHSAADGTGVKGELAAAGVHADDVPDPHVLDMALHPVVLKQLREAAQSFARLLEAVFATAEPRDDAT